MVLIKLALCITNFPAPIKITTCQTNGAGTGAMMDQENNLWNCQGKSKRWY